MSAATTRPSAKDGGDPSCEEAASLLLAAQDCACLLGGAPPVSPLKSLLALGTSDGALGVGLLAFGQFFVLVLQLVQRPADQQLLDRELRALVQASQPELFDNPLPDVLLVLRDDVNNRLLHRRLELQLRIDF